ncbi:hypothetical protein KM043_012216 [Ampulex compressa]|nr:hypothetical protein KM043_012216 [Ampulex compressa]
MGGGSGFGVESSSEIVGHVVKRDKACAHLDDASFPWPIYVTADKDARLTVHAVSSRLKSDVHEKGVQRVLGGEKERNKGRLKLDRGKYDKAPHETAYADIKIPKSVYRNVEIRG